MSDLNAVNSIFDFYKKNDIYNFTLSRIYGLPYRIQIILQMKEFFDYLNKHIAETCLLINSDRDKVEKILKQETDPSVSLIDMKANFIEGFDKMCTEEILLSLRQKTKIFGLDYRIKQKNRINEQFMSAIIKITELLFLFKWPNNNIAVYDRVLNKLKYFPIDIGMDIEAIYKVNKDSVISVSFILDLSNIIDEEDKKLYEIITKKDLEEFEKKLIISLY